LLTHGPTFFLLLHFYRIRPTTIIASFIIDIISMTVPYVLLRRSGKENRGSSSSDRSILQDNQTAQYTTIVASSILSVLLYISFSTWLPVFLVTHFEDIPDIRIAQAGPAGVPALFFSLLPAGYAVRDLLINPSGLSSESDPSKREPAKHRNGEYLVTYLYRRTWGALDPTTRVLSVRTLTLATMVVLNTTIQVWGTMKGVDIVGATGWGAIWAVSILVIGLTFGWIQGADGS
jgi:hypothetical protein